MILDWVRPWIAHLVQAARPVPGPPPTDWPLSRRGEWLVRQYLEAHGYTILGQNLRVGPLEIDLLAQRQHIYVVCEVKTRRRGSARQILESINHTKIERVRRAGRQWLQIHGDRGHAIRFDVAAVRLSDRHDVALEYMEDAF